MQLSNLILKRPFERLKTLNRSVWDTEKLSMENILSERYENKVYSEFIIEKTDLTLTEFDLKF